MGIIIESVRLLLDNGADIHALDLRAIDLTLSCDIVILIKEPEMEY